MGIADIALNTLQSQSVRNGILAEGERIIDAGELLSENSPDGGGGFFSIFKRVAFELSGYVTKQIMAITFAPFSALWGAIVQTAQFIWNFDFNATDEQLDAQLSNIKLILAGQIGGTLGNLVGYTVCGIIPSAVIFKYNKALGLYLLKEVGEEALEEFVGNLVVLCRSAFYLGIRYLLTTAYKSARRAIKHYLLGTGENKGQLARLLFGDNLTEKLKAWGDGKEVWSFANEFNEFIDNIQNPALQEFTEEFFEEAFDACTEAGYVLARGLDAWYLQKKMQERSMLGEKRAVEITPDRSADSERVVLVAPEKLIKPAMTQYMTAYQMVENRDIGQFFGEPVREHMKARPTKFALKIVWSRFESPPMFQGGEVYKPPTLEIKGIQRTLIEFDLIKSFAGGVSGRNWGRFWASARLVDDDGNIVAQPRLYAGSEEEAEDLLTNLLTLSEFSIASLTTGEERKIGRKAEGRELHKDTIRVYPAYCTLLNAEKILSENQGQDQLAGTYKRRDQRLELWTANKPSNWDEVIQELLSTPGIEPSVP